MVKVVKELLWNAPTTGLVLLTQVCSLPLFSARSLPSPDSSGCYLVLDDCSCRSWSGCVTWYPVVLFHGSGLWNSNGVVDVFGVLGDCSAARLPDLESSSVGLKGTVFGG